DARQVGRYRIRQRGAVGAIGETIVGGAVHLGGINPDRGEGLVAIAVLVADGEVERGADILVDGGHQVDGGLRRGLDPYRHRPEFGEGVAVVLGGDDVQVEGEGAAEVGRRDQFGSRQLVL